MDGDRLDNDEKGDSNSLNEGGNTEILPVSESEKGKILENIQQLLKRESFGPEECSTFASYLLELTGFTTTQINRSTFPRRVETKTSPPITLTDRRILQISTGSGIYEPTQTIRITADKYIEKMVIAHATPSYFNLSGIDINFFHLHRVDSGERFSPRPAGALFPQQNKSGSNQDLQEVCESLWNIMPENITRPTAI